MAQHCEKLYGFVQVIMMKPLSITAVANYAQIRHTNGQLQALSANNKKLVKRPQRSKIERKYVSPSNLYWKSLLLNELRSIYVRL